MGEKSTIEWTDSTWNPVTGCTRVSAGCDNCYAHALAHGRLAEVYGRRLPVVPTDENMADPFAVRTWPERLRQPLRWKKPRMIFVNSMSELFHADIPAEFVRQIFEVMLEADHHTYQVLTKRPARALRFYEQNGDLFDNRRIPYHIWMGTSIENQDAAYRLGHLTMVPAEVHFLSCEPLIGPLELELADMEWVIAGGESGIGYRKLNLDWVRSIRDQCLDAAVPFFFKQVGGRTPKAGGRLLDGRTWDELPAIHAETVRVAV